MYSFWHLHQNLHICRTAAAAARGVCQFVCINSCVCPGIQVKSATPGKNGGFIARLIKYTSEVA